MNTTSVRDSRTVSGPWTLRRRAAFQRRLIQWQLWGAVVVLLAMSSPLVCRGEDSAASAGASRQSRHTEVTIVGDAFHINGRPTYAGRMWNNHKIEGLLFNSRMVQGIFDDLNPETRDRWAYPDTKKWDPERNTREFIAAMPAWREHGLLAFTINLQGGSPQGYSQEQPWHNPAIAADGSLRPEPMKRLERILDRADELGMAVILGLFYFGQDERLENEAAVTRAVDNAVNWVLDRGYRHVLIEVNNECNIRYDHAILQPERVHELIERVKSHKRDGRRLLVSTSYGGGTVPRENVVRRADFVLLHGNGVATPERLAELIRKTRQVSGYRSQPLVINEDDHFDFDKPRNNLKAAIGDYTSWGYFDPGGSDYKHGYQCPPVNWGINTDRKQAFFNTLVDITGVHLESGAAAERKATRDKPTEEKATQVVAAVTPPAKESATEWKAGVASIAVTPEQSTWMAGYASRDKPSEGKVQDLYAKALALEDAAGTRLVIVTTDLIGIPRELRDTVAKQVHEKHGLPTSSLLLNASHTHCGPVVRLNRSTLYQLEPEQHRRVEEYIAVLEKKLIEVVGRALEDLSPAELGYSFARAGFAMNRRLPAEGGPKNSPYPDGPVDHAVPVLRVEGPDKSLRALLFGYACHNTTLGFNQFCGDYAGFAQEYIQETHPGVTALFLMGCGGDQNPYPRRTLELARQHGRTLATAVEAALLPEPKRIHGPLRVAYDEVELEFAPPPTREELLRQKQMPNKFLQRHAELMLEDLEKNGKLRSTYSAPLQAIRFGDDLTLVALPGETVVDYSLRLKRELPGVVPGSAIWVAGYSNDIFAYVPSLRVLQEGGYEGGGAMIYFSLPGPFAPSVEERIVNGVHMLLRSLLSEPAATPPATPANSSTGTSE